MRKGGPKGKDKRKQKLERDKEVRQEAEDVSKIRTSRVQRNGGCLEALVKLQERWGWRLVIRGNKRGGGRLDGRANRRTRSCDKPHGARVWMPPRGCFRAP
jgi:hypothetical protein